MIRPQEIPQASRAIRLRGLQTQVKEVIWLRPMTRLQEIHQVSRAIKLRGLQTHPTPAVMIILQETPLWQLVELDLQNSELSSPRLGA